MAYCVYLANLYEHADKCCIPTKQDGKRLNLVKIGVGRHNYWTDLGYKVMTYELPNKELALVFENYLKTFFGVSPKQLEMYGERLTCIPLNTLGFADGYSEVRECDFRHAIRILDFLHKHVAAAAKEAVNGADLKAWITAFMPLPWKESKAARAKYSGKITYRRPI